MQARKVTIILGNGFDIDIGLPTTYKDFWDSDYCPKDYPAPLIRHLNERCGQNRERVRWYDLENELMYYYRRARDIRGDNDVITIEESSFLKTLDVNNRYFEIPLEYYTVSKTLQEKGYLLKGSETPGFIIPYLADLLMSQIDRDYIAFNLIKERLCAYLSSLNYDNYIRSNSMARALIQIMLKGKAYGNIFQVFSFNYTDTIAGFNNKLSERVQFVHGSCKQGQIVIGTGDTLEITREYDFLIKSFDFSYNPPALVSELQDSDEIIFFGHSIGYNDRQYFQSFFKQIVSSALHSKKNITMFTYDLDSELELKRALLKMTEGNLATLLNLANVVFVHTNNSGETDKVKALTKRLGFPDEVSDNIISWIRE